MALSSVPHLTTALTGPLLQLEKHLLADQVKIETWFRSQWHAISPPFYASVDLRNAGFKLAPVDTNLFPAGFNNLNPAFMSLCVQAMRTAIDRICPDAMSLLLIPENHTRNLFYLESLATLRDVICTAGYQVRIGSLMDGLDEPLEIDLDSGRSVRLEPIKRVGDRLLLDDFDPCGVLLNNDFSGGHPEILDGLEQHVIPPLALGWAKRLKSDHFAHYREVAHEFAEMINIDAWLVDPLFRNCGEINFKTRDGEECLASNVDSLLKAIQAKYDEYNIDKRPFVVVKADAGTYGMGVMVVHSGDEIHELNRKQRNKMTSGKGGQEISKVIMQEGVYTFETWEEAVAEPVVYMIDQAVVGGFYRVHKGRGVNENLNAPGMHFEPLAFDESCITPDSSMDPDANPNRFYAYGVIARLALLAAAREMAELA